MLWFGPPYTALKTLIAISGVPVGLFELSYFT